MDSNSTLRNFIRKPTIEAREIKEILKSQKEQAEMTSLLASSISESDRSLSSNRPGFFEKANGRIDSIYDHRSTKEAASFFSDIYPNGVPYNAIAPIRNRRARLEVLLHTIGIEFVNHLYTPNHYVSILQHLLIRSGILLISHGIQYGMQLPNKIKTMMDLRKLKKEDPESYAELQHVAALQNEAARYGNQLTYVSGNRINNHVVQSIQAKIAEEHLANRIQENQKASMLNDLAIKNPEVLQNEMQLKKLDEELEKIQEAEDGIAERIETNNRAIKQDESIVANFSETDLGTETKLLLEKFIQSRTENNIGLTLQRTMLSETDLKKEAKLLLEKSIQNRTKENIGLALQRTILMEHKRVINVNRIQILSALQSMHKKKQRLPQTKSMNQ